MQVTYVTADDVEVSVALPDVDARRVLEGLPVRNFPVYRGRKNYSGYFWSATVGGHVVYESLLELSWLWLADFDRSVSKIAAQPMRWRGDDAGRVRNRIPDFMCQLADGSVRVVDVKPASMLPRPEVTASLSWTKEVCVARGWDYDVWTGPNPVKLRNVQWVAAARLPHAQGSIDVGETVHAARDGCTFTDLEESRRRAGRRAPRLEVLGALWVGDLRCDLDRPIGSETWLEPFDG